MAVAAAKLPLLETIKRKARAWAAVKDHGALPDVVVEDCLRFGADSIYETLRIPPMEFTMSLPVTEATNSIEEKATVLAVPEDAIEFLFLRDASSCLLDNVTDVRSFFDPSAELPCRRYTWSELNLLVHPKQELSSTGMKLTYYRRLPALDALYSVIPENYSFDYANDAQPFLWGSTETSPASVALYLVDSDEPRAFTSQADANAYATLVGSAAQQKYFIGKEAWHWLKNVKEQLLLNAGLFHIFRYLGDDKQAQSYLMQFQAQVNALNAEERMRKAKGGVVEMQIRGRGML